MVEKSVERPGTTKEKTLGKAVQKEEKLGADVFESIQNFMDITDRLASAKVPAKIRESNGKEAGDKVQLMIDMADYLNEAGHMKKVSGTDPEALRKKLLDEAEREKAENLSAGAKATNEFLSAAANEVTVKYINTLEGVVRTLAKDDTPDEAKDTLPQYDIDAAQKEILAAARSYNNKLKASLEQNEHLIISSGRARTAEEERFKKEMEVQRARMKSLIKFLIKPTTELSPAELLRVAKLLVDNAEKLKSRYKPTAQDIINKVVEDRTKVLLAEFESSTGDLNKMRKKAIEFQEETNRRIRESAELAPMIDVLDELYHFGTIKGGIVGSARVGGTIAEKMEQGWRGFSARIPGQASESTLLLQAVARASGTTDMDIGKRTLWALENRFGRNWQKIVLELADSFLNAVPADCREDKKKLFAYLDKVIYRMMEVRGEAKVSSLVRTALKSGMLSSTGNRDWDNKREDVVKNLLQPNKVTRTMVENMNTYVRRMKDGWAGAFFEKNARDWQEIDDSIKTLLTTKGTISQTKLTERYIHIYKLINLIWVETHITDIEMRNVLINELMLMNSMIDAQAVGRMLLDHYLRNVKKSAFGLTEKEIKLLDRLKERSRSQMEYLTDDELWYEIQARIEKKLKEMMAEKGKIEDAPLLGENEEGKVTSAALGPGAAAA